MVTPRRAAGDGSTPARSRADARLEDPRVRTAALVVGVLAVSSAAVLVRLADAPALAVAFWRVAAGALALLPFALRTGVVAQGRQRWLAVLSGVLLAVHFALWFVSLDLTTVAASSVLVAMSPVVVGAGSALLLSEPPGRATWVGLWLAVAGAVVVAGGDLAGATSGRALLGDALAFAAAVAAAGYLLAGRHARRSLPVTVYATWTYGSAAVVLGLACLVSRTDVGIGGGYDAGTWLAIAGLVVGPQLLGHTVFNLVMGRVTATVVSVVIIAEPIGATLLAALLLGETPVGLFWLGAPLVLAGVVLASWPRRDAVLPAP
ncbi:MAG TPA: DMT family transporter [Euzebyales bacterium]|nr:DMT family transporter [Euzebyales bacterium]